MEIVPPSLELAASRTPSQDNSGSARYRHEPVQQFLIWTRFLVIRHPLFQLSFILGITDRCHRQRLPAVGGSFYKLNRISYLHENNLP
jgi:hypothetical protein